MFDLLNGGLLPAVLRSRTKLVLLGCVGMIAMMSELASLSLENYLHRFGGV